MEPGLSKKFSKDWIVREFWRMFRYGIVGGTSLLLHAGLYALLSRVLWVEGNRTLEYVIALVITAVFNFTLHRIWTFAVKGFSSRMVARYVIVILSSMGIQSGIFFVGVELMGIYDFIVFFISAAIAAFLQYLGHRMFTFNVRFENVRAEAVVIDAVDTESGSAVHIEAVDIERE